MAAQDDGEPTIDLAGWRALVVDPIERRWEVEMNMMSISATDGLILLLIMSMACRCQPGIGRRRRDGAPKSAVRPSDAARCERRLGDRHLDRARADAVADDLDVTGTITGPLQSTDIVDRRAHPKLTRQSGRGAVGLRLWCETTPIPET